MILSVPSWLLCSLLVIMVTMSAIIDYKHHRIPNWLSCSGWYLGPMVYLFFAGLPALSDSLLGLLVVLSITFPLFVLNWMGAGDVKLMTSVGAMVGIDQALLFLASIVISGFVIGVAQLVMRGQLQSFVRRCWAMLGLSMASGHPVYVEPGYMQHPVIMPYAISIAVGTFAALLLFWM